ncbi:MAG: DinB family protein [Bacteroidetes bacterium]|uniref:DinB family protein n=1 Tax=Phaeocystidibacter marisrubri TaxID=1577780 RepID=A0A6L3ZHK0_9FLAO|nr:DinB family protein [Phaeocystidibacter marisrubri]KAB2817068.1 DinB family protein [Phaeocystidibacter marisrubri]TNE29009.1 MAG: DinB family protein [Bacteroidota bacterium]GGH76987.1 hypothetical protein GCM10011318_26080 [Phaeocystidibacter marisrubri]
MTQHEFGQRIIDDLQQLQKQIETSFYYLEAEQLNAKPSEEQWSILQCIEHINLTNEQYIKAFRRAEEKANSADRAQSSYKMGWIGKLMSNAMRPKNGVIRYKMKTFDSLVPLNQKDPKARLVEHVVFEKFSQDCAELERLIKATEDYNWNRIKVQTLLGKWLKLKLGDAYAFVLAHSQRHVEQAMKLSAEMF